MSTPLRAGIITSSSLAEFCRWLITMMAVTPWLFLRSSISACTSGNRAWMFCNSLLLELQFFMMPTGGDEMLGSRGVVTPITPTFLPAAVVRILEARTFCWAARLASAGVTLKSRFTDR
ncbi:hypothetical protein D9M69_599980 [compost metagenome]